MKAWVPNSPSMSSWTWNNIFLYIKKKNKVKPLWNSRTGQHQHRFFFHIAWNPSEGEKQFLVFESVYKSCCTDGTESRKFSKPLETRAVRNLPNCPRPLRPLETDLNSRNLVSWIRIDRKWSKSFPWRRRSTAVERKPLQRSPHHESGKDKWCRIGIHDFFLDKYTTIFKVIIDTFVNTIT